MDLGRCVLPSSEVAQARSRAVDTTGITSRVETTADESRLDEKTARGLFGDDGDKDALRLLALEHSKTALAFAANLPEIQIRELASLGSLDREALFAAILQ